jgi:S-DNA-T family DNA segregation ATPase FtsK/SpoIIIE
MDSGGAEKLKGEGDVLYYQGNQTTHLQGALVTTNEISNLVEFIGLQQGYPSAMYLPEVHNEFTSSKTFDRDNLDPLFVKCAMLVVLHQQCSTSLVQRKLKLGYNRAGRIIDQLEAAQIIGPFEGSKAWEVLFSDEHSLMNILKF